MRKVIPLLLLIFLLVSPIQALAATQKSNAEVLLGYFTLSAPKSTQYTDYCTATLSHLNIRLDVTKGVVDYTVQRRAPNGNWIDMKPENRTRTGSTSGSITYNINAVRGHDYRMKLQNGSWVNTANAQAWCY